MTPHVIASGIIFFWALWSIFCRQVNDGVVGKVIYAFAALSAFSVLIGHNNTGDIDPDKAMTFALALLALRQLSMRYVWPLVRRYVVPCENCPNRRAGDL